MLRRYHVPIALLFSIGCAGGEQGRESATAASGLQITTAGHLTGVSTATPTMPGATTGWVGSTSGPDEQSGDVGGIDGDTSTSSTGADEGTSGGAGSSGDGPKFDLGVLPDVGEPPPPPPPPPPPGCHAIDVLFVLDNSSTIAAEQAALAAAAPVFVESLQNDLAAVVSSYHVGVITTDDYMHNVGACQTLGALVTQTGGMDSSMATCDFAAPGKRYMDELDNAAAGFACAGLPGTAGSGNERPAEAIAAALSPAMGPCNEGFLRPDALLVVVVLTDEDDEHEIAACMGLPQPGSPGHPSDWFGAVADAKGVETNAVVLGMWGPVDAPCPLLDQCNGGVVGAEPAPRLASWASLFTWHAVEPVCGPSFALFLDDAIPMIDEACAGFVAP